MATLTIEGQEIEIDDGFLSLSPADQQRTVEEIAQSMNIQKDGGSFAAKGFARGLGGLADFVNPFDKPHALNPFKDGTGSAVDTLERGFEGVGVKVPQREPEGIAENFAFGSGNAASYLLPFQATARAVRGVGGLIGSVADDAVRAMSGPAGIAGEVISGGSGRASGEVAEAAGAPDWAQTAAEIGGGITGGLAGTLGAQTWPRVAGAAYKAGKRTVAPFTKSGAEEVARRHVQALVGGEDNARAIGKLISPDNPLGLTPAQQTGDRGMLALQRQAAADDPNVARRLDEMAAASRDAAPGAMTGAFGKSSDARNFLADLQSTIKARLQGHVKKAIDDAAAATPKAGRSQMDSSEIVASRLRDAYDAAKADEDALWGAVNKGLMVRPAATAQSANDTVVNTVWAQQGDVPVVVRRMMEQEGAPQSVEEMLGLYSELRRVAREAASGPAPNKNRERLANAVAESVMKDLDTVDGANVKAAVQYTREMHEMFSQGAVGKLMRRTVQSDEQIPPQLTLDRTIGTGGNAGAVAGRDIRAAADEYLPETGAVDGALSDYTVSRYNEAAFGRDGTFRRGRAEAFAEDNAQLFRDMPSLGRSVNDSIDAQNRAGRMAETAKSAASRVDAKTPASVFVNGQESQAVSRILQSGDPIRTTRALVAAASKDKSGKALAGLKGSFSDYVVRNGLSGTKAEDLLNDADFLASARLVFDPAELNNLRFIAGQVSKLNNSATAAADFGALSDTRNILEMVARVAGAKAGAKAAGAGGDAGVSLQAASLGASRAQKWLGRLTNDRAQQLMRDAVTDSELMRTLMLTPQALEASPKRFNILAPYILGAATTQTE